MTTHPLESEVQTQAIRWINEHSRASGATRRVLGVIAQHLDLTGQFLTRYDELGSMCGVSGATVARAVAWLRTSGEVSTRKAGPHGVFISINTGGKP